GNDTTYTVNIYGATTQIDEPNPTGVGPPKTTMMTWATDTPDPVHIAGAGLDALMTSKTDALGQKTEYFYDELGNVIREVVTVAPVNQSQNIRPTKDDSNGGAPVATITTRYTYDPLFSKMTSKTDADGHTTWYIIDSPVSPAQDTGGGQPTLPG